MWERKSGGGSALRRGAGRGEGERWAKQIGASEEGKDLRAPRSGEEVQGAVGKGWVLRTRVFLLSPV